MFVSWSLHEACRIPGDWRFFQMVACSSRSGGGRLRVIRDGVLDPQAISGVPEVQAIGLAGLMDVALHPRFATNQQVYMTYSKPGDDGVRVALARGRLNRLALTDVSDLFVSDVWVAMG